MKITIEDEGFKVTTEFPDSNIHEVVEKLGGLLVAYGFHPESVNAGFEEREKWVSGKVGEDE